MLVIHGVSKLFYIVLAQSLATINKLVLRLEAADQFVHVVGTHYIK